MDLFEYQARDLFEKHNVPVLAAAVASTPTEAEDVAKKMGGKVVVKAQVQALNFRVNFLLNLKTAQLHFLLLKKFLIISVKN